MNKLFILFFSLLIFNLSFTNSKVHKIEPIDNIPISKNRIPKGFCKSPYSICQLLRYAINFTTNGLMSYKNEDINSCNLLKSLYGSIILQPINIDSILKIIFLGDIMVSNTGNPPILDTKLINLLKSADIIIANIESPLIEGNIKTKRKFLSLNFEMTASYIKTIYDINPNAKWIFSIANNHAFDTSNKNSQDISGLIKTIDVIKENMPGSEIIGAQIENANSILVFQLQNGSRIGVIAWTEIMNNDSMHYRKPIIRQEDIKIELIKQIKKDNNLQILIGFPHGNEEQSYMPLKETRNCWISLLGSGLFDIIVGTGPHVIQPAEMIGNRLIFHSIGNFCSPKGKSQTKVGCIPEITLDMNNKGKIGTIIYNTNFIEQIDETIKLSEDGKSCYPEIFSRINNFTYGLNHI